MLQLQKPVCPEPVPCSMRSHCDEKPTHRYKEQPLLTATTEAVQSDEDPMQQRKMSCAADRHGDQRFSDSKDMLETLMLHAAPLTSGLAPHENSRRLP
ncbi:hypothetical protein R6Z07F_003043 [Ovis aries]